MSAYEDKLSHKNILQKVRIHVFLFLSFFFSFSSSNDVDLDEEEEEDDDDGTASTYYPIHSTTESSAKRKPKVRL